MIGLTVRERLKANRVASVRLDAMVIGEVYGLAHDALVAQYASEPDGRKRLASDFEHLIGEESRDEDGSDDIPHGWTQNGEGCGIAP